MKLKTITSIDMGENCYIVIDESSKKTAVIDPGNSADRITEYIQKEQLNVTAILLTHCHFDHTDGLDAVKELTCAPVYICSGEEIVAESPSYNMTGMTGAARKITYDGVLNDGEAINIGAMTARVIKTPGHTPGGCCYYFENEGVLFSGDTIFFLSCGRTDFPGGSEAQLIKSICEKIFTLPDHVAIYSGHGEHTSVAFEKKNNPFA